MGDSSPPLPPLQALPDLQAEHGPLLATRGNARLLDVPLLAVLCSAEVPASVVIRFLDVVRAIRDAGVATISGFHSPLEKQSLEFLLRGGAPIVICPAREIQQMKVPAAWQPALEADRLLLVSAARPAVRRPTREHARARNRLVAALAHTLFVAYASTGGSLFPLVQEALGAGKPVFCLDDAANRDLHLLGVRPLSAASLRESLRPLLPSH